MRHTKTIVTLLCLVWLFSAIALFAQNLDQRSGTIRELSGTVELKQAGQIRFVPAKTGDAVAQDTIISTGLKSTALIAVGSTIITVRPLTRLSLSEISSAAGTETINVNLQAGRVRVDVNPPAGTRASMSVQSPNATASVRGTSFDFDTKVVRVTEGTVAFKANRGKVMLVNAGDTSQIAEREKALDPIETKAAELQPLPPAGSGSGHKRDKSSASSTEFSLIITFF